MPKAFKPVQELIIYRSDDGDHHIQTAPLFPSSSGVRRGAFTELTTRRMRTLLDRFGSAATRRNIGFLPENILGFEGNNVIWWVQADKRPLIMTDQLRKATALTAPVYNWPALVFKYNGYLNVYVANTKKRPTPETRLLAAPFWNTQLSGNVCLGTARIDDSDIGSIVKSATDAFFNADFTHTGSANAKRSLNEIWSIAADKPFPYRYLHKSPAITVGNLFK